VYVPKNDNKEVLEVARSIEKKLDYQNSWEKFLCATTCPP
jgi:hypothetical protein